MAFAINAILQAMKIIFLGTNGWYDTPTGNTPCVLLDSKDYYIIFDAGNGIYKLDQYIKEPKPIYLFISHLHIDHISGLHILDKFNFPQGINICLPPGRKKDFDKFYAPPFTSSYKDLEMKITIVSSLPFNHTLIELFHSFKDHGIRITLDGSIIAYSGDCGICPNSKKLAQDADILIHECSKLNKPNENWGHVTPKLAATLAKDSNVKKLILTHFDASLYTTLEQRKEAEKIAQKIFPNTIAATDDMIISF